MNIKNSFLFSTDLDNSNKSILNNLLIQATVIAKDSLKQFATQSDFDSNIRLAFGNDINPALLQKSWTAEEFVFPEIEVVNRAEINNANGAFARETNKIYLAQEFLLANVNNLDAVRDVVLEEYGHFVDSQLNVVDALGDEGDIFLKLTRGKTIDESQLRRLKQENDTTIITLDGNQISIEQALASNSKGFSDLGVYVNGILWGGSYWEVDSTHEISFSFLQDTTAIDAASFDDDTLDVAFDAYTWELPERTAIAKTLKEIAKVANITFKESSDNDRDAKLKLYKVDEYDLDSLGKMKPPGESGEGFGYFNKDMTGWDELNQGRRTFYIMLHELLHGLGLSHPHDYGGNSNKYPEVKKPRHSGKPPLNKGIWTVMSYNNKEFGDSRSGTPMAFDIAALQYLYGPNLKHNTGNQSYDLTKRQNFYHAIWDAGGEDTFTAESAESRVRIDLRNAPLTGADAGGYISQVTGKNGGFTIAAFPENSSVNAQFAIENAIGSDHNDTLRGNEFENELRGRNGNDLLVGQTGNDTLDGGVGKDSLIGANPWNKKIFGDEIDILTGGTGQDEFFFGNPANGLFFYDDNDFSSSGLENYALITDLEFDDKFKYPSLPSGSSFVQDTSPFSNVPGTAIYLNRPGQTRELIAIVQFADSLESVNNFDSFALTANIFTETSNSLEIGADAFEEIVWDSNDANAVQTGLAQFLKQLQTDVTSGLTGNSFLGQLSGVIFDELANNENFNLLNNISSFISEPLGGNEISPQQIADIFTQRLQNNGLDGAEISLVESRGEELIYQLAFNSSSINTFDLSTDFGLPDLGLSFDGEIGLDFNTSAAINFGVNLDTNSFFIDTSRPQELDIDLILENTQDLEGKLGFLSLTASDLSPEEKVFSSSLSFGIDLQDDPNDQDDLLTLNELDTVSIEPSLIGELNLNPHLELSNDSQNFLPKLSTDLAFNAEYDFLTQELVTPDIDSPASLDFNNVTLDLGSFSQDFAVPVLEKVNSFLDPIRPVVKALTSNINFITDPFPSLGLKPQEFASIMEDFGGDAGFNLSDFPLIDPTKITLLDLLYVGGELYETFSGKNVGVDSLVSSLPFIQFVNDFDNLVNALETSSKSTINLGDFGIDLDNIDTPTHSGSIDSLPASFDNALDAFDSGLNFPLLNDPQVIFDYLRGKPVDLFTYDIPTFNLDLEFPGINVPVWGPIVFSLAPSFDFTIFESNLDFGFDTNQLISNSGDVLDILSEGFYLNDNYINGIDNPEATLVGELFAGLVLGTPGIGLINAARAGGIVGVSTNFDLKDGSDPSKVRLDELTFPFFEIQPDGKIYAKLDAEIDLDLKDVVKILKALAASQNASNRLLENYLEKALEKAGFNPEIVDGVVRIGKFVTTPITETFEVVEKQGGLLGQAVSWVTKTITKVVDSVTEFVVTPLSDLVGSIELDWESPEVILWQPSDSEPEIPPLASLEGNTLWLNIGPRWILRNTPDIEDIAETIAVSKDANGNTVVSAFGLRTSHPSSYTEIRADGGAEGDRIYIDVDVTTFIDGGTGYDLIIGAGGNDNFNGGSGNDSLIGDLGNDNLSGGENEDELDGGAGNDTLKGDGGNDTLLGDAGDDRLEGGTGEDSLVGDSGNDNLFGGDNNDSLSGGNDNDNLYGDEGDDRLEGNLGNDNLYGGLGSDNLYGNEGDDRLEGNLGDDNLYGGSGSDNLYGNEGKDLLVGSTGKDLLDGGSEDDVLLGDEGEDTLRGSDGSDFLDGGTESDRLFGEGGDDYLKGAAGNDTLEGGTEDDILLGGIGNDSLSGEEGQDSLEGNAGLDTLRGGLGNDTLKGGNQNDRLAGDGGNDELYGDAGNDTLEGGTEDDDLFGGLGNDSLTGDEGHDSLEGNAGIDILDGGLGNDTLKGGDESDRLAGDGGNDKLYGDAGNDTLEGGTEDDTLFGGTGNDTLTGEEGQDSLEGNAGLDTLRGGLGNDTLKGGDEDDLIEGGAGADSIDGGTGNDTATYISSDAGVSVDLETGQGSLAHAEGDRLESIETLVGSTFGDTLQGSIVNERFEGRAGDDFIDSRDGIDTLYGEEGNDTLRGGTGDDSLEGNADNDFLYGEDGIDTLRGGTGDDSLEGNANNDSLYGEDGNDTLRGGTRDDSLEGNADNDFLYGEDGIDTLYGGTGDDSLEGNADNDFLYGEDGKDVLKGQAGKDVLRGGKGNDTLEGGLENDTLEGNEHDDRLYGQAGEDAIDAGSGNDYIEGGTENDTIYGHLGNDTLCGNEGNDYLEAGDSNDSLYGASNDSIFGGSGDDTLKPGFGEDIVDGGEGTDTLVIDYSTLPTAAVLWSNSEDGSNKIFASNAYGMNAPKVNFGNVGNSDFDSANNISADGTTVAWDRYVQKLEGDNRPLDIGGGDRDISLSADGSKIAYIAYGSSGRGIYVSNADGSDAIQVFSGDREREYVESLEGQWDLSRYKFEPHIMSGDGSKVLWKVDLRDLKDQNASYIAVANSDGTGLIRSPLYANSSVSKVNRPFISGDGSKIAWLSGEYFGVLTIKVANSDFSEIKEISIGSTDGYNSDKVGTVSLSADGSQVAWSQSGYENSQKFDKIFIASTGSDPIERIDAADIYDIDFFNFSFSPDGDQISYIKKLQDGSNNNGLFVSNTDGTGEPALIAAGGFYEVVNYRQGLSEYVDIGVRYGDFDVDTGSGEILTWGPSHVNFSNVEKFDLIGTIYGDELQGGNLNDTLEGNGGADTLNGGDGDDTYQLDADTAAGSHIEDTAGKDTLILDNLSLSLQLPTVGIGGIQRENHNLNIDLNRDGIIHPDDDLTIVDFFADTSGTAAGQGFIETVANLAGNEILTTLSNEGNDLIETGNGTGELFGGLGNDTLQGSDRNDTLNGEAGTDTLKPGWGEDVVDGGEGTDTLVIDYSTLPTAAVIWSGIDPEDGSYGIFASNPYGMNTPKLNFGSNSNGYAISADGTTITWSRYVQKSEGDNQPINVGGYNISLSADGSKIAYKDGNDLYVSNADGSDAIQLFNRDRDREYAESLGINWDNGYSGIQAHMISGDGSKVVIEVKWEHANSSSVSSYIVVANSDGTGAIRSPLYSVGSNDRFSPFISGDGSTIAWIQDEELRLSNGDFSQIETLDFVSGIDSVFYNSFALSSDGSTIAWQDDDADRIWVAPIDGSFSDRVDVSGHIENFDDFSLSPDGDQISFVKRLQDGSNNNGLFVANADGTGEPALIASGRSLSNYRQGLSSYVDIGVRYGDFDVDTGSGEILTWGPSHVNFSNVEKFDLIGTIYGDELKGGNFNDTLEGNGGADTLNGGDGDDTYKLDADTAGGSYIEDTAGKDTLELANFTLSSDVLIQDGTSLIIDLNRDGIGTAEDDLTIDRYFANPNTSDRFTLAGDNQPTLDIDGNGLLESQDYTLIDLYASFGNNAGLFNVFLQNYSDVLLGEGATRKTGTEITDYLTFSQDELFDLDGNNQIETSDYSFLDLYSAFGANSQLLDIFLQNYSDVLIGENATRTSATEIISYLNSYI